MTGITFAALAAHAAAIKMQAKAGCPFGFDQLAQTGTKQTRAEIARAAAVAAALEAEEAAAAEEAAEAEAAAEAEEALAAEYDYVAELFDLTSAAETTTAFTAAQYEAVWSDIVAAFELVDATNADNSSPRGAFVGCLLRLEGHDFMDYRIDDDGTMTGGSDGCINLEEADNLGLPSCILEYDIPTIYSNHSADLSLADFFVIAAEAAMSRAATDYNADDQFAEGTLAQKFRDGFKYGRTTVQTCDWNTERMPNPEYGCNGDEENGHDGLKQIFVNNIYAGREDAWTLTAAISGAHTVGSASPANSGYDGHWADTDNQGLFNNHYYHAVIARGWAPELAMDGNTAKNQWKLVDEGANLDHKEMMLNTDLCLAYTHNQMPTSRDAMSPYETTADWETWQIGGECRFNEQDVGTDLLADTANGCCAWLNTDMLFEQHIYDEEAVAAGTEIVDYCGMTFTGDDDIPNQRQCCGEADDPNLDCDNTFYGQGPAFDDMLDFMRDESLWLRKYLDSWWAATENNYASLTNLDAVLGETRQELSDDMNTNCLVPAGQCDEVDSEDYTGPCFLATGAIKTSFSSQNVDAMCFNKHRPISEQRPNRMLAQEWQWMSIVSLENPTSSSALEEYTAERPLHPQWRIETGNTDYHYHASPDNDPWTNSCAWTADGEETSWWSADFVGGESAVQNVQVFFM